LTKFHVAREKALNGQFEDDETWDLHYPVDYVFKIWRMIETFEWKHLPDAVGLLDQEEALWEDLTTVAWVSQVVEAQVKEKREKTSNG
jgi:uncharacterized membrane protein